MLDEVMDKAIYAFAVVSAAASFTGALVWYAIYWPDLKDLFKEIYI